MTRLAPLSIRARLSLLLALASALLLLGLMLHLYRSLASELEERDLRELSGKVETVRRALREGGMSDNGRIDRSRLDALLIGDDRLYLRILDADGKVLYPQGKSVLPAVDGEPAVAEGALPRKATLWRAADGKALRIATAWARPRASTPHRVLIQVALDISRDQSLLLSHGPHLAATFAFGATLAAFIGWFVADLSLRPLVKVASAAKEISAKKLDRRLDREETPAEIRTLVDAFNGMLDRLEDNFRRLDEFSSDLAHELRTSIGNLMLQTQVTLSRPRDATAYVETLQSINEEMARLSRMTEEMLFLARADQGQGVLCVAQFALEEEAEKVIDYYETLAQSRQIAIDLRGHGQIEADRSMVRRAINNLVANAIQHSPDGCRIDIEISSLANEGVELRISNRGTGIPPEHLSRVFDRFFQVKGEREPRGSGLGLAIVKSIMQLHGGEARVESRQNELTTFVLFFPVRGSLLKQS